MELYVGPHLEEGKLEQYSMGRLPAPQLAEFEEHLLACSSCQDRLLEMESYINAMRSVSPRLREPRHSQWKDWLRWPRPAWGAAFAFSALTVAMGIRIATGPHHVEIAAVNLMEGRGIAGVGVAEAPAGKLLALNLDLTELPASAAYRLQVVDVNGATVWDAAAKPQNNQISQTTTVALIAGQYFVRLYLPQGRLLREFSLKISPAEK